MSLKARLKKLEQTFRPKPKLIFTFNRDDVDDSDESTIYIWFNLIC
jgi:hypothetical protein